ncbi:hypothetical protein FACS1894139_12570 [Planctomycetales bacterium]|nr:hypothetical protein FACS1894107_14310 [Planctomycetales bacterium]GHS96773.1 hypothetical protein FACS1894108_01990 [Planctomycetales bacterium]GHT06522.1 hypothetical protein FACS1894139_12570 [Planctomycetales bacterium]
MPLLTAPFNRADEPQLAATALTLWRGDVFIVKRLVDEISGEWRALQFAEQPASGGDFCAVGGRVRAGRHNELPAIFARRQLECRDFFVFPDFDGDAGYCGVWLIFRGALAAFAVQQALAEFEQTVSGYRFWGCFPARENNSPAAKNNSEKLLRQPIA